MRRIRTSNIVIIFAEASTRYDYIASAKGTAYVSLLYLIASMLTIQSCQFHRLPNKSRQQYHDTIISIFKNSRGIYYRINLQSRSSNILSHKIFDAGRNFITFGQSTMSFSIIYLFLPSERHQIAPLVS
ncbi:unnamed protein product [Absidia cylindrospora]